MRWILLPLKRSSLAIVGLDFPISRGSEWQRILESTGLYKLDGILACVLGQLIYESKIALLLSSFQ